MEQQFNKLHQRWAKTPPPQDPQGLLKEIWDSGILSEMQKEMIAALLSQPEAPAAEAAGPVAPADPAVAGGNDAIPSPPAPPGGPMPGNMPV